MCYDLNIVESTDIQIRKHQILLKYHPKLT